MAELHITKASSALRLIECAIKMHDRGDDRLAVYVVASSACSALRELLKTRGTNYSKKLLQAALFSYSDALDAGTLPQNIANTTLLDAIRQVSAGRALGSIKVPDDIHLELTAKDEAAFLSTLTGPFNFLKHADRDPLATMTEDRFNEKVALAAALSAFSMLFPGEKLSPEVKRFVEKLDHDEHT